MQLTLIKKGFNNLMLNNCNIVRVRLSFQRYLYDASSIIIL